MKKTTNNLVLLSFLVTVLFIGCGVSKLTIRKVTYADTHKAPQDITIELTLPKMEPSPDT